MKIKKIITFPTLIKRWRKYRISTAKSIVIIPHGNLGDLIAIYAGLIEISKYGKTIYLCCRQELFNEINLMYGFPDNVKNIRYYDCYRKFKISNKKLIALKRYGKIFKLGYFWGNKIYKYPNSFYHEMGLNESISEKSLRLQPISFYVNEKINFINSLIGESYVYMNTLSTHYSDIGKEESSLRKKQISAVYYINQETIGLYNYPDKNTLSLAVDKQQSLRLNIELAKKANYMILSDAGFFNIIIRILDNFSIILKTRKNKNSHNKNLYPFNFSGQNYSWLRIDNKNILTKIDSY